jgi:hypothetical protein
MTPLDAIVALLERLGASNGAAILVSEDELRSWPVAAVKAMKSQRLLVRATPAMSTECPGCEQECIMPVHTPHAGLRSPAPFIVCDKRDDINRVPVSADRLTQWRCDPDSLCGFAAQSLGLSRSNRQPLSGELWEIGMATGDKRRQMLCLKPDGELALVAGNNSASLSEFVSYRNGKYLLDQALIRQLVDSACSVDSRYTPTTARRETRKLSTQTMYDGWRKAYRGLRKSRPNMSDVWYSRQIAKQDVAEGRHPDTIKKHMRS